MEKDRHGGSLFTVLPRLRRPCGHPSNHWLKAVGKLNLGVQAGNSGSNHECQNGSTNRTRRERRSSIGKWTISHARSGCPASKEGTGSPGINRAPITGHFVSFVLRPPWVFQHSTGIRVGTWIFLSSARRECQLDVMRVCDVWALERSYNGLPVSHGTSMIHFLDKAERTLAALNECYPLSLIRRDLNFGSLYCVHCLLPVLMKIIPPYITNLLPQ